MKVNQIIQGDTLEVLKTFSDDFIDTIITSPPYWGLRDYGVDGQIGLESTLEEFIEKLLKITAELKRVLKPTGVMYWNHGDAYTSSGKGMNKDNKPTGKQVWVMPNKKRICKQCDKEFTGHPQQKFCSAKCSGVDNTPRKKKGLLQPKCLMLQNYRLILKIIDQQGWILRNTIVWHKPNHMPSSVKDRFANSYEPVFILVKRKKYWFDLDAVRKPHKQNTIERCNYPVNEMNSTSKGKKKITGYTNDKMVQLNSLGKNPGDMWKIATQPFSEAHFATFPEKLITPMILSSCPKEICKKCGIARERIIKKELVNIRKHKLHTGMARDSVDKNDPYYMPAAFARTGVQGENKYNTLGWTDCKCKKGFKAGIVLDPFMGSGTVGVVAKRYKRNYLGIELNSEYIKIAKNRIKAQPVPML